MSEELGVRRVCLEPAPACKGGAGWGRRLAWAQYTGIWGCGVCIRSHFAGTWWSKKSQECSLSWGLVLYHRHRNTTAAPTARARVHRGDRGSRGERSLKISHCFVFTMESSFKELQSWMKLNQHLVLKNKDTVSSVRVYGSTFLMTVLMRFQNSCFYQICLLLEQRKVKNIYIYTHFKSETSWNALLFKTSCLQVFALPVRDAAELLVWPMRVQG